MSVTDKFVGLYNIWRGEDTLDPTVYGFAKWLDENVPNDSIESEELQIEYEHSTDFVLVTDIATNERKLIRKSDIKSVEERRTQGLELRFYDEEEYIEPMTIVGTLEEFHKMLTW